MRYAFPLLLFSFALRAQYAPNLLENASLEHNTCASTQFDCLQNVYQANTGSCDLYKNDNSHYPHGHIQAQDGAFCIGALALYPNGMREYPVLTLREPLDTNQMYEFSAWICLASRSGCALRTLQIIGLQDTTPATHAQHLHTWADTIHIAPPTTASHWQQVVCQFRPRQTWRYLSIGNVLPNHQTDILQFKTSAFGGQKPLVYYYYDNFELKPLENNNGARQISNK